MVRDPGGGRALRRVMDEEDIAQAIADYVLGAQRLAEAGLDGVDIISSMHLPGQFLNPQSNRRDDKYGGRVDLNALAHGRPQPQGPGGGQPILYRIGDPAPVPAPVRLRNRREDVRNGRG